MNIFYDLEELSMVLDGEKHWFASDVYSFLGFSTFEEFLSYFGFMNLKVRSDFNKQSLPFYVFMNVKKIPSKNGSKGKRSDLILSKNLCLAIVNNVLKDSKDENSGFALKFKTSYLHMSKEYFSLSSSFKLEKDYEYLKNYVEDCVKRNVLPNKFIMFINGKSNDKSTIKYGALSNDTTDFKPFFTSLKNFNLVFSNSFEKYDIKVGGKLLKESFYVMNPDFTFNDNFLRSEFAMQDLSYKELAKMRISLLEFKNSFLEFILFSIGGMK